MKITANCCEITKSVWVYMYTFWEGLLSNEFRNFVEKKSVQSTQYNTEWFGRLWARNIYIYKLKMEI